MKKVKLNDLGRGVHFFLENFIEDKKVEFVVVRHFPECGEAQSPEIVGHVLDWNILEKKESFRTNMAACDVPCRMTAPNIFVDQVTSQMEAPRQNSCFI